MPWIHLGNSFFNKVNNPEMQKTETITQPKIFRNGENAEIFP